MIYDPLLSQDKSSSLTLNKFCLNTYEQQLEIDTRINKLMKSLIKTDDLRIKTEASKNNLKEEVRTSFNALRANLLDMESKLNSKIDADLDCNRMESQMRSIESQVNQLIGGLKNMSMLTDSQKLLILKNIDHSIDNLESTLNSLELSRTKEIEKLKLETAKALNDSNKIGYSPCIEKSNENQNFNIQNLSVNMSSILKIEEDVTKKILNQNDDYNYSDWLLRPKNSNNSTFEKETISNSLILKKVESFEDLCSNKDFDILSDSDSEEFTTQINSKPSNEKSNFFQINESQKSSPFFSDIYAKPMEFWLLKKK